MPYQFLITLDVVVSVPNDWDENDVMEYYRNNGADGEFVEDAQSM